MLITKHIYHYIANIYVKNILATTFLIQLFSFKILCIHSFKKYYLEEPIGFMGCQQVHGT